MSECKVGYKRGHCIAVLAFCVCVDFQACVAGGILVPGERFWRRSCHGKWTASPRGKILIDFKLTCIPTLLAATPQNDTALPRLSRQLGRLLILYLSSGSLRKQTTSRDATVSPRRRSTVSVAKCRLFSQANLRSTMWALFSFYLFFSPNVYFVCKLK